MGPSDWRKEDGRIDTLSVGAIGGNLNFSAKPKVCMVETRSMAAQHDQSNGVDGLETFVSNEARPKTPRVNMFEQKIQGLTTNIQLLME